MLQIDQLIACLQSSVNQHGLLADKKREGRYSGDYFFFTVCVKHFSGFIKALDSMGTLCTLQKVLRQPHNVLTLLVSLSLRDKQFSCLLCKFISPEVTGIKLFANLRVFLVGFSRQFK